MANIDIDNLAAEITLAVREYTEDVSVAIAAEADRTSGEIVKELREKSPRRTGEYAKGWTRRKEGGEGDVQYTVHNKNKPWLAHLLEHGHAKRSGGRVEGKPHIRPVAEKHIKQFEDRVRQIIRDGG